MFKHLRLALLFSPLTLATSPVLAANVDDVLANICNIVAADDKSELRKKLMIVHTDHRLRLHDYYDGISCDGNSLIRTAVIENAVNSGSLLIKKLPKVSLLQPEADGKTLQAWIEENGLSSNPVAQVLASRI